MNIADSQEKLIISASRHFPAWLAATGSSIAFTTYQAGKLFLLGVKPDGRLAVFERSFPRCMGLGVTPDGTGFALATESRIQRFDDVLPAGETTADGNDALFAPHAGWVTGDVDAHDVGWGADGRPLFVATLFSCIATVSDDHSFRPVWQPPFVSRLAAEDRCHLNGMAIADGVPRYASAVSRSDLADGWRDRRQDGGVVIDVASGEIVVAGLSMPHSPRLHAGRLWMLNSGTGDFGWVDPAAGRFEAVAICPGYARGLAFLGGCAIVGLSLARDDRAFSGLALDAVLRARDVAPRCGLAIVDLASGDMIHWVRIEGVVRELYDIGILPGTARPAAIGVRTDEINRVIAIDR